MTNENQHDTTSGTEAQAGFGSRILYLPDRYVDLLFVLSLLTFTLGSIYYSSGYDFDAQILPLLVGLLTVVLIGYLLVKDRHTYFAFLYDSDPDEGQLQTRRDSVIGFLWISALTAIVLLIGIETGVFVFLLLYYRYQTNLSWGYTVVYSLVIWLAIIVLFVVIVQAPLYEGYIIESL